MRAGYWQTHSPQFCGTHSAKPRSPSLDVRELVDAQQLLPGVIFVRNRFDGDRFIELTTSWEHVGVAKYAAITTVCQSLGALYITVSDVKAEVHTKAGSVTGNGSAVDLTLSGAVKKQLSDRLDMTTDLGGGPANIRQARADVVRFGLSGEPMLDRLIQLRENTANPLGCFSLSLDLLKEVDVEFGFGAALAAGLAKAKINILSMEASYTSITRFTSQVTIEVGFSGPRKATA